MRTALRISAGFALLTIGIMGLLLPVMPGWIFVIPGLIILSEHFTWARDLKDWARKKAAKAGIRLPAEKHEKRSAES